MGTPNKDFRENHNRAIYVSGIIDQELIDKLTPTINRLRLENTEPVTVYIDSRGGSAYLAENLRRLIKTPNPDGGSCRVITVVTGTASSAAADLLVLGDYAIAHPHTNILYHGSRRPMDSALTYEGASSLALSLQESNEMFALRLARRAFPRFCLRISQFSDEARQYINQQTDAESLPITPLTKPLRRNLSRENSRLVRDAVKRQELIKSLTSSVDKDLSRFKTTKLSVPQMEGVILKAIIKYKIRYHRLEPWSLSGQGLSEVTNDFRLLHDFHFGSQKRELDNFVISLGELFLLPEERTEYGSLTLDEQARVEWLKARVLQRLQPLWYFVVSYCRLLQTADYSLSPVEAYWFGLVDEVCGSGLPNLREMVENLPTAASQAAASQAATK